MLKDLNEAKTKTYDNTNVFYFAESIKNIEIKENTFIIKTKARKYSSKQMRSFNQIFERFDKTDEMIDFNIYIDCIFERSFRIRYSKETRNIANDTIMLVENIESTKGQFKEDDNSYTIYNSKSKLIINKNSISFKIYNENNDLVLTLPGFESCHPNNQGAGGFISFKDFFPLGVNEYTTTFTTKLKTNEKLYGLGERFVGFNRRGQNIQFYHQDCASCSSIRTYKNVPFYISNENYGIFNNTPYPLDYDLGMQNNDFANIFVEDSLMDVFIITGNNIKEVIKGYCDITGYAKKLPRWSYGLWMSRNSYETKKIALDVAKEIRKRDIPCDVIHLDTFWFKKDWVCDLKFDSKRFAKPKEMIKQFRDMGFQISLWQMPFVHPDTDNYKEGIKKDYFVKTINNDIYLFDWFKVKYALIDFSNEEAINWYLAQIESVLRMGAKVIKTDIAESYPMDGIYKNIDGKAMHNLFPLIYNKVMFEKIEKVHKTGIIWARSTYAGGQRYPVPWSGDARASFDDLAGTLRGGLSLGLSGQPFWSHDIGGFIGRPTPELYIRWAQVGLFSSHSRCHGGGNTNFREPWAFGEKASSIFKKFVKLRYRLLPYIFTTEAKCINLGMPFIRPILLQYQKDRNTHDIYDQYFFGESILIAPILSESNKREVYFPSDIWYNFFTGEKIKQTGWVTVKAELDDMPMYVKEGTIIPFGPDVDYVDQKDIDILYLHVYGNKDCTLEYVNNDIQNTFKVNFKQGKAILDKGNYKGKVILKVITND